MRAVNVVRWTAASVAMMAFPTLLALFLSQTVSDLVDDSAAWVEKKLSDISLPLNVASREGDAQRVSKLIAAGEDIDASDSIYGLTPLHEAASSGSVESVRILLDAGATVDSLTNRGQTPLHAAAFHGHLDIVEELIDAGADADKVDHNRDTPLFKAADSGNADLVKFLIDAGASVNGVHEDGRTPLFAAAWNNHVDAAGVLLSEGADVDGRVGGLHPAISPMYPASQFGNVEVIKLLLAEGADPEHEGRVKSTPLHIAASHGQDEVVSLLLDSGITDVDEVNGYGYTPLQYAVMGKYPAVASRLMDAGADPDRKIKTEVGKISAAPLTFSASRVVRLVPPSLGIKQTEPGKLDRRQTPLFFSLRPLTGDPDIVAALVEGGADLNAKLSNDATILHLAVDQFNDVDRVRRMLEYGADPNSRDVTGSTPLHYAAFYGYDRTASMLIENGANVSVRNYVGKSALEYTECLRNNSTEDLLIKHGATRDEPVEGDLPMREVCLKLFGNKDATVMRIISWTAPLAGRLFRWFGSWY